MTWIRAIVDEMLTYAGWPGEGRQPHPMVLPELREKIGGGIKRTVPETNRRYIESIDGGSRLLVLHGGGDQPISLYRATLRLSGDDPTLNVERIDLARRVLKVAVTEQHSDEDGRPVLRSVWRFELEGTDPLEIKHEQTSPGEGRAGRPYQFARAVAEAAGWAPEHTD